MGVDVTTYLVYGIKLDYDKTSDKFKDDDDDFYDLFENEMDGAKDARFDMIMDGMSGKYIVVGKVLARLSQYGDGDGFKEIDLKKPIENAPELIAKINQTMYENFTEDDFKILFFNHYH